MRNTLTFVERGLPTPLTPEWPKFCDVSDSSAVCKLPAVPVGGIESLVGNLDGKLCTQFGRTILCKKDICPLASSLAICLREDIVEPVKIQWPPECLVCDGSETNLRIPKDFVITPNDLISTPIQLKERSPQLLADTNETDEIIIIIIWK